MKHKKLIITLSSLLILAAPAFAVFNERDLGQTISVLRFELKQQYDKLSGKEQRIGGRKDNQHRQMIQMMKKCNELSLILYSQGQDYTLDLTYALGEVTREYDQFTKNKLPYDDMLSTFNLEIDRYERLIESLRRLPPSLPVIEEIPDSLVWNTRSSYSFRGPRPQQTNRQNEPADSAARAERAKARRAFVLDEQGQEDRDSCIMYAMSMLHMYKQQREKTLADQEHYGDMSERLKSSYDYAQAKYSLIQKRIFIDGQDDYFTVLGNLGAYATQAFQDAKQKYTPMTAHEHHGKHAHEHSEEISITGFNTTQKVMSEWRGPIVIGFIFFVLFFLVIATVIVNIVVLVLTRKVAYFQTEEFKQRRSCATLLAGTILFAVCMLVAGNFKQQNFIAEASGLLQMFLWLLIAILTSMRIRISPQQLKSSMKLYTPVLILGLVVITFRIIFIPNKLVNLIYPPILLGFAIWQFILCRKERGKVQKCDMAYAWITLAVMVVSVGMSWAGYVLLAVQVFIWWLFQLTAIASITALYDLLGIYDKRVLTPRIKRLGVERNIQVTWAFDFVEKALLPVAGILSLMVCISMASDVFDLSEVCESIFFKPFFDIKSTDGNSILHLSLFKIVLVSSMFFIFRYVDTTAKALYKHRKLEKLRQESEMGMVHPNQVNLTLANNLFDILIWGSYVIMSTILLKIPMGAISVIAAGLATGIGLALKDVLNNFIYGIQLMSGRVRVGDYIECDGIRGKVDSISYQTTQICTPDGGVMSFTNSTLFNKNFKNLTHGDAYELVSVPIGIAYGSNVSEVRQFLLEELSALNRKDAYGRDLIDPKRGITVAFSDFGDSSVNLVVKQYVLVEEKIPFMAAEREMIYNSLNAHKVEIPFPQQDLYIRTVKE